MEVVLKNRLLYIILCWGVSCLFNNVASCFHQTNDFSTSQGDLDEAYSKLRTLEGSTKQLYNIGYGVATIFHWVMRRGSVLFWFIVNEISFIIKERKKKAWLNRVARRQLQAKQITYKQSNENPIACLMDSALKVCMLVFYYGGILDYKQRKITRQIFDFLFSETNC